MKDRINRVRIIDESRASQRYIVDKFEKCDFSGAVLHNNNKKRKKEERNLKKIRKQICIFSYSHGWCNCSVLSFCFYWFRRTKHYVIEYQKAKRNGYKIQMDPIKMHRNKILRITSRTKNIISTNKSMVKSTMQCDDMEILSRWNFTFTFTRNSRYCSYIFYPWPAAATAAPSDDDNEFRFWIVGQTSPD